MNCGRYKVWSKGRILYFQTEADAEFWDDHWTPIITKEYYRSYEQGNLDELEPYFEKYLKRDDRIVEAGCGTGRYIVSLMARGFRHVEGIEWGEKTVQLLNDLYPELPVRVGDVTRTGMQDNYLDAYISLGVMEHRREGPASFLKEANRILKPGAIALISVPFINPLRRLKGELGFYRDLTESAGKFYQYAFSKSEFAEFLKQSNFEIIEAHPLADYFGFVEELPGLIKFLDWIPGGWRIKKYIKSSGWIQLFGHMMLFVCRKTL